jgi:hypothetical protein
MIQLKDVENFYAIFETAVQTYLRRVFEDQPRELGCKDCPETVSKLIDKILADTEFLSCCQRIVCEHCDRHWIIVPRKHGELKALLLEDFSEDSKL